jgi:hypothetical protein
MAKIDISKLEDSQKCKLVEARWSSSSELWDIVSRVYRDNTNAYENKSDWVNNLAYNRKRWVVHANRIFVNMESVINSLIANPPGVNVLPARDGDIAKDFAKKMESFLRKRYLDLNIKETVRMGYRNLYFGRLLVIKPFWNPIINDFDYRAIDPRKVRFGKYARKEQDSEFAIEEIEDNLCAVIDRFPKKREELMNKYGLKDDEELYIQNPDVKYKEAWLNDYVIFKLDNIILDCIKNPYWDWDGILITDEEEQELGQLEGDSRRQKLQQIKLDQSNRKPVEKPETDTPFTGGETEDIQEGEVNEQDPQTAYKPYYFNYFDFPRKPYIFATIFNNENTPIGRTDMITLSAELQRGIDKRKIDIDENCELVNGITKVDSSVMGKSDAQRIRFETKGVIWGKGVKDGVTRETGTPLPEMVFKDMLDSRSEIDNIMAASSAFRGEREGQETKAGRLALIQQSFLRLNELIQLGDYVAKEIFDWGMQLAKTRYTEPHYAKWMGKDGAREVIELMQDDFETGTEIKIIAGKSLPVDDEFKFEQAQNDVEKGFLSPADYLEIAQYDNAKELAQNNVKYQINKVVAVGITPEEMAQLAPPQQEEKPPSITINYADLPFDAQVQLLEKVGIQADPQIMIAEKQAEQQKAKDEFKMKQEAQAHGQVMAEKSQAVAEKTATSKIVKK